MRAWWVTGLGVLMALGQACGGDTTAPEADGQRETGLLVSPPIPAARLAPGSGASSSLAFVSATPGTSPGATRILVAGTRGDSASALAIGGGFDPLPVAAGSGDRIDVTFVDSGGRRTARQVHVRPSPPRVVRASPTPTQTDVPLNVRILVVFSAPIDAESAAEGVQLVLAGSVVPVDVRQTPDGIGVELVPVSPLAPATEYEVRVDAGVRDVVGTPLGAGMSFRFRTGTTFAELTLDILGHRYPWLGVFADFKHVATNQAVDIYSQVSTKHGDSRLTGWATIWSSSDPTVVRVTERAPGFAVVEGMRPGQARISAQTAGLTAETLVYVYEPIPPDLLASVRLFTLSYSHEIWLVRGDGSEPVRVLATTELPEGPSACLTAPCYWTPYSFAVGPRGQVAVAWAALDTGGVWVKDGVQGALRQINLAGERGAAHSPAWSQDGQRLAYWFDFFHEAETELRVVNADGSGQRVLQRIPYDTTTTPPFILPEWAARPLGGTRVVWHADGRRLLLAAESGILQLFIDDLSLSPYLLGYQPGPWFPDAQTQFVYQLVQTGERLRAQVFRANAHGVVDRGSAFEGNYNVPVAVSRDGRFWASGGAIFTADRRASHPVSSGTVIGFAP